MLYSLVGILALIIAFIVNGDILFTRNVDLRMKALPAYRAFLFAVGVFLLADILWGIFRQCDLTTASDIVTACFFFAMTATVFGWIRFVVGYLDEKNRAAKVVTVTAYILLFAGWATVIVNFFVRILFAFSSDGDYQPKLGRFILLAVQMVLFLVTSAYTFHQTTKSQGTQRVRYFAVAFFGLVMAVAVGLQAAFPDLPLYSFGMILGITILRIFVLGNEKREYLLALEEEKRHLSEQEKALDTAKELAYVDPLTGAKNKHAYVESEEKVDALIRDGKMEQFALAVFDLNDLKAINDTKGHEAGDLYLKKSYALIRKHFPETPVYRYGGDEFVVALTGEAFLKRHENIAAFNADVDKNLGTGEPVVATGLSDFRMGEDNTLRAVFGRADESMYARKRKLKQSTNPTYGLRDDIYEHFYRNKDCSLMELLNNNSADEVMEVDMNANSTKHFYHVPGKYAVPTGTNLGYRELYQFVLDHIVHPDDRELYARLMEPDRLLERLAKGKIPNFDFAQFRYKTQAGGYRYVEQAVIAGEENGLAKGTFRIYVMDIHNLVSRKQGKVGEAEEKVESDTDGLTGLLNERAFFTKAQELINAAPEKPWCVACIDIEHFKFFDEWYGRETGDLLLANIGVILKKKQEGGNLACYLGQDDFAFLCPYSKKAIEEIYEEVRDLIVSFGLSVGFLPAIGVACLEEGQHAVDAYDRANIALSHAKKDIRIRISLFDERLKSAEEEDSRILSDFMAGLKNDEFTFYLQPQVRMSTGKIVGAESLARWIRSDGSITPPNVYIPILEKYGFIVDLDQVLWEKVAAKLSAWIKAGHKPVPVSVNISRIDIFTIDIAKFFRDLTKKYDLPHKYLKLEITESAYGEATDVIRELVDELRKDGFMVLMDDFGSGYSSLNMLNNLQVDAIKLDAGFLSLNGDDYERGIHILESVINMAKIIGLPTIIEGVETKEQSEFLQNLGCRYAQGYYFSRPIPVQDFEKMAANQENLDFRGFIVKTNEQFRIREFLDKNIYSDNMLNSILGPVAIYAWDGQKRLDIVRFNQQFYEAVNVPDFSERIANIERWMPERDIPEIAATLKKAMENKLSGAVGVFHFVRTNGTMSAFRIHFFYLGKQEGEDRFYGSALDITTSSDLLEEMQFIGDYGMDNLIFIKRIDEKWVYHVASHGLSDFLGLSVKELEDALNDGTLAKLVTTKKELSAFMAEANEEAAKKQDFVKHFPIKGKSGEKKVIELSFYYVGDRCYNVVYVLRTKIIVEEAPQA